jgi:hypothetical protein
MNASHRAASRLDARTACRSRASTRVRGAKQKAPASTAGALPEMDRWCGYPVNLGAAVTAAAAVGVTVGAAAVVGGAAGVTGAAGQSSLSLVSLGLPGPLSSPPAPRPFDPVWQFECTSPLASGSGLGVAAATDAPPAEAANAATATRLTNAFFIGSPLSHSRIGLVVLLAEVTAQEGSSVTGREAGTAIPAWSC